MSGANEAPKSGKESQWKPVEEFKSWVFSGDIFRRFRTPYEEKITKTLQGPWAH